MSSDDTIPSPVRPLRSAIAKYDLTALRSPELLSHLVHRIGHEMGNPLTAIISLGSVMERLSAEVVKVESSELHKLSERLTAYTQSLVREAWQISVGSERLVLLLSLPLEHSASCSLERILPRIMTKFRARTGAAESAIQIQPYASGTELPVDSEQAVVFCVELLCNAFFATHRTGDEAPEPSVRLEIFETGGRVVVRVTNPISAPCPLELEQLFEPFVSQYQDTKKLGLGLTLVHAIASRFGGIVEVSEYKDPNLCFAVTVSFPVVPAVNASGATKSAEHSEFGPQRLNVLIVEDEANVASALEKLLKSTFPESLEVSTTIAHGTDALNLLGQGLRYDAILCDLNLGHTSGKHLYETIQIRWPEMAKCFAFLSGEVPGSAGASYIAKSGRPLLRKPFEVHALVQLIDQLRKK